jgi:hypothetical protein
MVLGPFAETKGPRLPGRNPASIMKPNNSQFMEGVGIFVLDGETDA